MNIRSFRLVMFPVIWLCLGSFSLLHGEQEKKKVSLLFEAIPVWQTVQLGKPIYFKFRISNVGRENTLVNKRFYLNDIVSLEVKTPSGEKATWCGHIPQIATSPGDFVILAPGARIEKNVRISCDENKTRGYAFSRPGEYVVSARYELPFPHDFLQKAAGGALVAKGPIAAKPVHLRVMPAAIP